jgi:sugar phosphate isomerase/epimerase
MANKFGIVSISFRQNSPIDILEAAKAAGLDAVEWVGDVHSPHGNTDTAEKLGKLSREYGITPVEYGSYYSIGQSAPELFEKVKASALALGTNVIRVWPGQGKSSDSFSNEEYDAFISDARRICDAAPECIIALECHPNSLTDEYHTAIEFINDVGRDNLKMFWQPNQFRSFEYNVDSIKALLPYIVSVHVFSWRRKSKYPLNQMESNWKAYIELLRGKDISYMLEFMHDGNIETLNETAQTLKSWFD